MSAIEGALGHTMARGDLDSQEFGSAARADGGKPDWGLMPLDQIRYLFDCEDLMSPSDYENPVSLNHLIHQLGQFQRNGRCVDSLCALKHTMIYLAQELGDPIAAYEEVIRVWEYGQRKYAAFNWMKGMSWNSVIGAYMRHIVALQQGEHTDPESGRHHGAHLVCNAMMLVHFHKYYPQGNDLPTRWFRQEETDESGSGTETA